jgi:MerR family transcriptional regulator, mercuric resistance operon regulatory protein
VTGLRSGEVARAAGVNQQTLRYYERRGLLAEPLRTPGGHRLYPAEAVTVVRVIKAAQRLGFSLGEVAELIETGLPRSGHGRHGAGQHGASQHGASQHGGRPGSGLRQRAAAKLAEVEAKIADLTVIAETLRAALAAGCDDLIECAHEPRCPVPFAILAGPSVP